MAAAAWDSCGEHARARATRRDLAMSALFPLGRFDEALAVLGQLLSSSQMSDAERSWVMVMEGFALFHANRLDSAEARFARVTDLGYLHENPRLVATAAWGHALVAWRRNDRAGTIRRLASAENTALGVDDDVLGIPFLCDAADALGAFGELELAEQYLRAGRRPAARCSRTSSPRPASCSTPARAASATSSAGPRATAAGRVVAHPPGRRLRAGPQRASPTPPPATWPRRSGS